MKMSQAEWQVMRVLWAYPNIRSTEVVSRLEEDFDWKPATVKTLLNRLKGKGLIQMEKLEGKFYYRAEVSEEWQWEEEWRAFLGNICQTNHGKVLLSVIESVSLSVRDLEVLKGLLDDKLISAPNQVACACPKGQCACHHVCERK
ncbi:BlaI/MecI/CopY family transcriptional regulator [Streptococcus pneumoniae]